MYALALKLGMKLHIWYHNTSWANNNALLNNWTSHVLFVCRSDILFCHIYQQFNGVPQGRPLCPYLSWSVYQPLPTKEVATISPCLSLSSSLPQQLVMQFKCSRLHSFCQWFIWGGHMGAVEQINGSLRAWTCIGHRVSANTVGSV